MKFFLLFLLLPELCFSTRSDSPLSPPLSANPRFAFTAASVVRSALSIIVVVVTVVVEVEVGEVLVIVVVEVVGDVVVTVVVEVVGEGGGRAQGRRGRHPDRSAPRSRSSIGMIRAQRGVATLEAEVQATEVVHEAASLIAILPPYAIAALCGMTETAVMQTSAHDVVRLEAVWAWLCVQSPCYRNE